MCSVYKIKFKENSRTTLAFKKYIFNGQCSKLSTKIITSYIHITPTNSSFIFILSSVIHCNTTYTNYTKPLNKKNTNIKVYLDLNVHFWMIMAKLKLCINKIQHTISGVKRYDRWTDR